MIKHQPAQDDIQEETR